MKLPASSVDMAISLQWFCEANNSAHSASLNGTAMHIQCVTKPRLAASAGALLLSLMTIFGNGFIITAILTNRKLGEKLTSILITNLSLADLCVGSFVMPLTVVQTATQGHWLFSRALCRVWISLDVICCTASIANLCVISIDRFIGVMRPLRYNRLVTRQRLLISALGIWIFSIAVLLVTLRYPGSDFTQPNYVCHIGNEQKYVIYAFLFSFFIPLVIVMIVYWKIYLVTRRREKSLLHGLFYGNKLINGKQKDNYSKNGNHSYTDVLFPGLRIHYGGQDTSVQSRRKFYLSHKKAAKTLGIVVGAFVICWFPFFFCYLLNHFCDTCVSDMAFEIVTWIGYSNSAINPIIYTVTWKTFRATFKDMLLRSIFCRPCTRHLPTAPRYGSLQSTQLLLVHRPTRRQDPRGSTPGSVGWQADILKGRLGSSTDCSRTARHTNAHLGETCLDSLTPRGTSPVMGRQSIGSTVSALGQPGLSGSTSWMTLKLYRMLISSHSTEV